MLKHCDCRNEKGDGWFDDVLSRWAVAQLSAQKTLPQKVLVGGNGVGRLSSHVAGWMASREIEVILLDGANRFDPYAVSFFARSASIPPEKLLKKIRIARAFTCYQMAALMGEKLPLLLKRVNPSLSEQRTWIIFLGPLSTFLDEDVPEREARSLLERTLKKAEGLAAEGIPLLIFQAPIHVHSKRSYFMKRLVHFSDWAWKIEFDDQGPGMTLEKEPAKEIPNHKHPITTKLQ
jgi:hypothetical protein